MSTIVVEKAKVIKQPEVVTPDVVVLAEVPKETVGDKFEKVMTSVADAFGKLIGKQAEVQGVPGTAEHPEPDGDEGEDCVCEKCGSTYKAKKAKEEPAKEEPVKEEAVAIAPVAEAAPVVAVAEVAPVVAVAEVAPDLSTETWRKMVGTEVPKTSKAMQTWQEACGTTFDGNAFKE